MEMSIDISEEAGVRYLHFGSEWIQGAMRLKSPATLELHYTREMMSGLLLREAPWPRRVLVIGLGAASMVRFLHRHFPQTVVDVVEIEPRVVIATRQFFALPEEDERLAIHIADGADFIAETDYAYDLILADGFDHKARTGRLSGTDFYTAARARLSDTGLMAVNLFSRGFAPVFERLARAFDNRVLTFASRDEGNMISFAAVGDAVEVSLEDMRNRAEALKRQVGLDLSPTVSRLEQAGNVAAGVLRL